MIVALKNKFVLTERSLEAEEISVPITSSRQRNPLLPWWIGIAIIVAAVMYVAYRLSVYQVGLWVRDPWVLGVRCTWPWSRRCI